MKIPLDKNISREGLDDNTLFITVDKLSNK
jgi:hypothetical protein